MGGAGGVRCGQDSPIYLASWDRWGSEGPRTKLIRSRGGFGMGERYTGIQYIY